MRFVGIDLAWGGLAVLDRDGVVVAEGWATSDELSGFLDATTTLGRWSPWTRRWW